MPISIQMSEGSGCNSALSLQSLTHAQQISDENDLINFKKSLTEVSATSSKTSKQSSESMRLIEPSHLDYKSGAVYDGKVKDYLKFGQGVFLWPNGDKYMGEFKFNSRHGYGSQFWSDGSFYEGHFIEDKRNGQGVHHWNNGENFEGTWFLDYRHGYGKYQWHETSNVYEGMFFMNLREGYGTLRYASGDLFIGLYKKDNRYGPGILRYPNDTEDVGYWNGDKLVRLLVSQNSKFNFEDLEPINKKVELCSWYDRENLLFDTLNPQNLFLNRLKSSKSNQFIKDDPYMDKVLKNKTVFYDEFIKLFNDYFVKEAAEENVNENIVSEFKKKQTFQVENVTPHLLEIFKHYQRFAYFQKNMKDVIDFNVDGFQNCNRDLYAPPGFTETHSIQFLNACNDKNINRLKELRPFVNIDVCDNEGYSPLIVAVLNCDYKMINYLLDNGANINHLLDNGLSALMVCVIRYYVSDKFIPNSALKHQDLSISKKLNPDSIVHETEEELKQEAKSRNVSATLTKTGKGSASLLRKTDSIMLESSGNFPLTEFASSKPMLRFKLDVNEELANKYADLMSKNDKPDPISEENEEHGKILDKKRQLQFLNELGSIIELLIRRGANPSLSCIPYPALCFAVSAGDIKIVRLLIEKGVDVNGAMPSKYYSLSPLCLACGVQGEIGPELVKLLLDSLADPNACADTGSEYLSMCEEGWENDRPSDELEGLICGRTPLHIACARNDPFAVRVVKLLLEHSANPNLICNGQTALSLAIAAGNKEIIDLLLKCNLCDPNMPLTYGIGSALCMISSTLYEHKWSPSERIKLIDKLIHFGADILQPIAFGQKRSVGSVCDYAYYMYNPDVKLAQTPYHSLSIAERATHNARKELLEHLGRRFREKAMERTSLFESGIDFNMTNKKSWGPAVKRRNDTPMSDTEAYSRLENLKKMTKWCYNCGRTVGMKLLPCSRCKKVYFCSNSCKQKAWLEVHKNECQLADNQNGAIKKSSANLMRNSQDNLANNNPNHRSKQQEKNRQQFQQGNNKKQTFNKFMMDRNNKFSKQMFAGQRMMNRPQFAQSTKISIHPLYGLPDNYSYN